MKGLIPRKVKRDKIYTKLKLLALMIIVLFAVGTLGYAFLKQTSLQDGFVLTVETLALEHQNETGANRVLQLSLLLFGVFIFWFVLWTFFDLILEGKLGDFWRDFMTTVKAEQLKDHYIICGAGRVGIHVAELLQQKNIPYVIIEKDKALVDSLTKKGFLVLNGDALEEDSLKSADIEKAKAVVAVIPETEKNVLIALIARHLNPNIMVYARAEKEELIKQLHHAGVKHVVTPEVAGARELVSLISREEASQAVQTASKKVVA
ncbi:MAG: potassium channel family protein [Candidatus Micrarchaeia archaeon]